MMIIYFFVALIATMVGAVAGLGGGVIIKPVLDMLGDYSIVTISILSSITVLSMAIISTGRQMKKGFKITKNTVIITLGAVFGGILGSFLFSLVTRNLNPNLITIVQSVMIMAMLTLCLLYERLPRLHTDNLIVQYLIGVFLGMLSSFLGIGGGPINVAVMFVFLGLEIRDAAKVSIFIILFAQLSGLIVKAMDGLFAQVEAFNMLLAMIPAAIIGGIIGSQLNIKLSDKRISIVYKSAVLLVMLICIYNITNLI